MISRTLVVLFGPGELPTAAAEALVDLTDAEVALVRGSWGWAARTHLEGVTPPGLSDQLKALADEHGCDHAVVSGPLALRPPELIVMDVDSTVTTTEAIDLLAERAGAGEKVAAITERAMRGELDFGESLTERVATLKGLSLKKVDKARAQVTLQPGAEEVGRLATKSEIPIALVSGGFAPFVEPLATALPAEFWAANTLEVADDRLTGRVVGEVIDRAAKARKLRDYSAALGIDTALVVAVGDGANDLDMLDAAGLGIAFCAKPVTAAQADVSITFPRLDAIWAVLVQPQDPIAEED